MKIVHMVLLVLGTGILGITITLMMVSGKAGGQTSIGCQWFAATLQFRALVRAVSPTDAE
eukprot:CAMPEP_0182884086 /NCGR_PEP_ID=MMETSP0034_2-20130328/18777_1 /TAXON_ID=156128 /ORGANISM="Nephroselmis pyriformis, Strain CCMP717" /LENGTH=59 /DNA_ID=CAMNT_0025017257 /DNA_START=405 /DNA_END=581 /DNA_ORIENTATION=-